MVTVLDLPPSEKALTGNAYLVGNFEGMFEGAFFVCHVFSYHVEHAVLMQEIFM